MGKINTEKKSVRDFIAVFRNKPIKDAIALMISVILHMIFHLDLDELIIPGLLIQVSATALLQTLVFFPIHFVKSPSVL